MRIGFLPTSPISFYFCLCLLQRGVRDITSNDFATVCILVSVLFLCFCDSFKFSWWWSRSLISFCISWLLSRGQHRRASDSQLGVSNSVQAPCSDWRVCWILFYVCFCFYDVKIRTKSERLDFQYMCNYLNVCTISVLTLTRDTSYLGQHIHFPFWFRQQQKA